jgi:uncharacterized protein YjiS (DUF1127 family)
MFLASQSRRREMDHLLPHRVRAGLGFTLARAARRVLSSMYQLRERSRQRHALVLLSEDLLRDVGLTRHDVAREAAKPSWRK